MLELLRNKRILVVVAHPDDELLGLGATMNRLIEEFNVTTHVVILGEGITSRSNDRDKEKWKKELLIHNENIIQAQKAIGYHSVATHNFPDNRFDSVQLLDIIKIIEKEKTTFQPDVIFTHHGGDVNIDHQRTFEAVMTATRPMEHEKVSTIITFETPSGTEWIDSSSSKKFNPNIYIEVSKDNVNAKIQGMESYEFEKRKYPHPRSPEALIIQSQRNGIIVGKDYCETFQLIRNIST
jgi:LmbE family N-acetylglucosaminyl deacetylase